MRHFRSFRGSRSRGITPVTKSFKKVINSGSGGFGTPGFQTEVLVLGVDAVASQQTSATDPTVPTGHIVKYFEVQFAISNLVSAACYINCTIQYLLHSQTVVDPDQVGGNPRRNQVLHMDLFTVGADQNSTHKFKFKIPKKYQRVREGMQWNLVWSNSAAVNRSVQTIYKEYS